MAYENLVLQQNMLSFTCMRKVKNTFGRLCFFTIAEEEMQHDANHTLCPDQY